MTVPPWAAISMSTSALVMRANLSFCCSTPTPGNITSSSVYSWFTQSSARSGDLEPSGSGA